MPEPGGEAAANVSYRALWRVPGLPALALLTLLGRLGGSVWSLGLVLFVLQRFHSPSLAGLTAAASWLPGLACSPIAGALLDRHGRKALIALDLAVAVSMVVSIAALDRSGRLAPAGLVLIVGLGSITLPLTMTGTRSLMPLLTPRPLWDRMNALDSASLNVTELLGPVLAGLLFASLGGLSTLLFVAAVWLAALCMTALLRDAPTMGGPSSLFRDTLAGLRYTLANPSLRALAVILPISNAGWGMLTIALPVLVLGLPHGGSLEVGLLWSVFGLTALVGSLLSGRVRTSGREGRLIGGLSLVSAVGLAVVAVSALGPATLLLAAAGMVIAGAADGGASVPLFSFRQRVMDPAWFGRSLAISISLSVVGLPLGSALAGPLLGWSVQGTLAIAASLELVAGGLALGLLRHPQYVGPPPAPASPPNG
ncbi:MAG: MFS transporter [Candidatus Dormibacteraeota bacterium]|nr:MFS transporter [Candidatus Dormibacteraeota bacterium]